MEADRRPGEPLKPLPVLPTLVGILTGTLLLGIALPHVEEIHARSLASDAFLDVSALRVAAVAYHEARGEWPTRISAGDAPGALAPYLPSGFTFQKGAYDLGWEHFALPGGLPPGGDSVSLVGVSIRSPNPAISRELVRALGPDVGRFTVGETTTIILEGL